MSSNDEMRRLKRSAVFVDRDGVLNVERATWVRTWDDWEWIPGALEGLFVLSTRRPPKGAMGRREFERGPCTVKQLENLIEAQKRLARMKKNFGWGHQGMAPAPYIIVVTNQSGVGGGALEQKEVEEIHGEMRTALAQLGISLGGVEVCYHTGEQNCECRKPKPGLILRAADKMTIDLGRSFTIGDARRDIEAGQAAGTRTVLVRTGKGVEEAKTCEQWPKPPDWVVDDLLEAALWINDLRAAWLAGEGPP